MTNAELRELDAWIDLTLFGGGKLVGLKKRGLWYRDGACGYTSAACDAGRFTREDAKKHEYLHGEEPVTIHELPTPCYTTSPAEAMRVLEKCAERGKASEHNILIYQPVGQEPAKWAVGAEFVYVDDEIEPCFADTLELAICLFARKLFEK